MYSIISRAIERYRRTKSRANGSLPIILSHVFDFGLLIYFIAFGLLVRLGGSRSLFVRIRTAPVIGIRLSIDAIMRSIYFIGLTFEVRKISFAYGVKKEWAIISIPVILIPFMTRPLFI